MLFWLYQNVCKELFVFILRSMVLFIVLFAIAAFVQILLSFFFKIIDLIIIE